MFLRDATAHRMQANRAWDRAGCPILPASPRFAHKIRHQRASLQDPTLATRNRRPWIRTRFRPAGGSTSTPPKNRFADSLPIRGFPKRTSHQPPRHRLPHAACVADRPHHSRASDPTSGSTVSESRLRNHQARRATGIAGAIARSQSCAPARRRPEPHPSDGSAIEGERMTTTGPGAGRPRGFRRRRPLRQPRPQLRSCRPAAIGGLRLGREETTQIARSRHARRVRTGSDHCGARIGLRAYSNPAFTPDSAMQPGSPGRSPPNRPRTTPCSPFGRDEPTHRHTRYRQSGGSPARTDRPPIGHGLPPERSAPTVQEPLAPHRTRSARNRPTPVGFVDPPRGHFSYARAALPRVSPESARTLGPVFPRSFGNRIRHTAGMASGAPITRNEAIPGTPIRASRPGPSAPGTARARLDRSAVRVFRRCPSARRRQRTELLTVDT